MKKTVVILFHIGYWLCYLLIIAIMVGVVYRGNHHDAEYALKVQNAYKNIFLFAFFPAVLTFYLCYFLVFPKYLQKKKFLLAVIFGISSALGSAIVGYLIHRSLIDAGAVIDMDEGGKNGSSTYKIVLTVMTFINSISGLVALVIRGFITWFEEVKLKEELKQKNHETELALVKAQLDPHFLFNTLNNIDVLIVRDPNEASSYLNKLSDILRFMLYETKADQILLEKEIKYIEKYIELQKIRTSNSSYINFSVTGSTDNISVAPMIFIPFIENAFKHTTNKKTGNAIKVQIMIQNKTIIFVCENKFDPNRKMTGESNGLGNELIQKRLDLLYPEKHKLEVNKQADLYSVHLTIMPFQN